MADTIRTRSALVTLLADNIVGNVSEQDLRDFLISTIVRTSGDPADAVDYEQVSRKNQANGYPGLDANLVLQISNILLNKATRSALDGQTLVDGAILQDSNLHTIRIFDGATTGGWDPGAAAARPFGYTTGRYYDSGGFIAPGLYIIADILYMMPYYVGEFWQPDRICVKVTTTGTATHARLGIYKPVTKGTSQGATLVGYTASPVAIGTLGLKEATLSGISLFPGPYWLALQVNGDFNTNFCYGMPLEASLGKLNADDYNMVQYMSYAYSNGDMPATISLSGTNAGTCPQILLKKA